MATKQTPRIRPPAEGIRDVLDVLVCFGAERPGLSTATFPTLITTWNPCSAWLWARAMYFGCATTRRGTIPFISTGTRFGLFAATGSLHRTKNGGTLSSCSREKKLKSRSWPITLETGCSTAISWSTMRAA